VGRGIFNDTIKVYTAPSGTQYVKPIDIFFSYEEVERYVAEAKAKRRAELIKDLRKMAQ
jgi:hypothetical protein